MRQVLRAGLVALVAVSGAERGTAAPSPPRDINVRTALTRTAVWVADRVTYTVTIACNKGVDILPDDMVRDRLHVDGLEILGSESDRVIGPDDRTIYTFRYYLTTYRVDLPELKIAPMAVRYYVRRAGQRVGDTAPAGEVQVPAAAIAFRSTLPDGQDMYSVRDGREPRPRPLRYAWQQQLGASLILISIVPAAAAAVALIRRTRPREKPRSARQIRDDERALLDELQALDISTPAGRREAYARVNALVREHVHAATGVDATCLTPAEIDAAVDAHDRRIPVALATALLTTCDQARYMPPDALPSVEACRQAIEQAAQVLGPL